MRYALVAALLFVLAACGSAAPTPTPTPTVKQAAATAYLAAETTANTATTAAAKLCAGATPTVAQYKACFTALSTADQAFAQALAGIHWPSDIKAADTAALTKALTQSGTAEGAIAAAIDPNSDYADATTLKTAESARIAAAAVIRHDLGLPPVALTPKPAPTVKQTAAAAYLAAATKSNTATDAANALCPGASPPVAQLTACYTALSAVEKQFIQDIFAITFPPEMKADVDALISSNTQLESAYNGLAHNPTTDYADAATINTQGSAAVAASGVMRHDLGLPPVPTL